MNAVNARRVLAQTVIIAAAAAGAWQIGLRPQAQRLAQAQAALEAERAEITAYQSLPDGQAANNPHALINDIEARAHRLAGLSDRSGRTAGLYDLISSLATRAGVEVERIDPKGTQNPLKNKQAQAGPAVAGATYAVEVNGSYERVADFLGILQNDAGLTKIVSFRMTPSASADGAIVNATIETAHYRLVADPAGAAATIAGGLP